MSEPRPSPDLHAPDLHAPHLHAPHLHAPDLHADVVIVGGGVIGSAVAHYLAACPATRDRSILVVERDPSYRSCATARSAGGVRQQFSTPESIAMSQAGVALVRNLRTTFGPDADVGFREQGYLLLASPQGAETLARNVAVQRRHGADVTPLGPAGLARRFPWIATRGLAAGAIGERGEGFLDGASLMALFRTSACRNGARIMEGEVTAVHVTGSRATAIGLRDGRAISCGTLVNCAGPDAGALAALAGLDLPVVPQKRFVFVFDVRDPDPALRQAPLTVDPSGVWFRPEGDRFICGRSPTDPADEPLPGDLDVVNHDIFEHGIWPTLAMRVPAFAAIKLTGAWAGHYDTNTFDHNAVIGPHPDVTNVYFCNGFSGHGLQHAAAAGRAIAELVVDGGFVTLDLSRFSYARLAAGAPIRELNVI